MTMTVKVSAISNELHYREMFSFHQILISGNDNPMIDYNQSSDRKGFDSINRSQNLTSIMIEINSKKDVF